MVEHNKTYHSVVLETSKGPITIEGPLPTEELRKYHFHKDLIAFRPAAEQFEALLKIADFLEGRIIVSRTNECIIGYVTYLYPDPIERWSKLNMKDLLMLGAIEVIPDFRSMKVASNLLKVSMMDSFMENYIIISTEYYWHWDLKGMRLSVWEYRKVMEKMMATGGLHPAPTDDPEILSHPANCLVVKIGKNVPKTSIKQFDQLRFFDKYQHKQ